MTQSAALAMPMPSIMLQPRPVDLVHLALQTQGNKDLETEVLRLFLHQSTVQIARISSATTSQACFEAAHKLKGSARAIGASGVADCAEAVEIAATTGQDVIGPLTDLSRAVDIANHFIIDIID